MNNRRKHNKVNLEELDVNNEKWKESLLFERHYSNFEQYDVVFEHITISLGSYKIYKILLNY